MKTIKIKEDFDKQCQKIAKEYNVKVVICRSSIRYSNTCEYGPLQEDLEDIVLFVEDEEKKNNIRVFSDKKDFELFKDKIGVDKIKNMDFAEDGYDKTGPEDGGPCYLTSFIGAIIYENK